MIFNNIALAKKRRQPVDWRWIVLASLICGGVVFYGYQSRLHHEWQMALMEAIPVGKSNQLEHRVGEKGVVMLSIHTPRAEYFVARDTSVFFLTGHVQFVASKGNSKYICPGKPYSKEYCAEIIETIVIE